MRTRQIKQIGYVIGGTAELILWGGGEGSIEMKPTFIPYDKFNKTNMLRAVNDNSFGVESITGANIDISIKYDNGSLEWVKTIYTNSPIHSQHFLGWQELNKILSK